MLPKRQGGRLFIGLLLLVVSLGFWGFIVVHEYLPKGGGKPIRHTYYTLGYNVKYKQADWVYYELKERGRGKVPRGNDFRVDPKIQRYASTPEDYKKSGYDRGHLCPAADMSFDVQAMSETFYMSNMSPQVPAFNRGIWRRLEEYVRKRSRREVLYVVTGPVFKENKGYIGTNKVAVPGYFYKLFYAPASQQMLAYVLPNKVSNCSLEHYAVSVDKVEAMTGIDFFSQLPDEIENLLESDTCSYLASLAGSGASRTLRKPTREQRWTAVTGIVLLFLLIRFGRQLFFNKWQKKSRKRKGRK